MKNILCTVFVVILLQGIVSAQHFTANPSSGCSPLEVSFTNNNPSGGYIPVMGQTTGFHYFWDFGNGQTSTQENPSPVIYDDGIDHDVVYSCVVDTVGFYLTQIDVTAAGATDPLGGAIDIYIVITDANGTEVVHTAYIDDTDPPVSFQNLNLKLDNPPYFIRVWDYDSMDHDDNCADDSEDDPGTATILTLPINNSTTFGTSSQNFTNNMLAFTAHYYKPVTYLNDTVTIDVIPAPAPPTLNYTSGTFCSNEMIPEFIANGNYIEWYSDSLLTNLIGTGNSLNVDTLSPGIYTYYVTDFDSVCHSIPVEIEIEIIQGIDADINATSVSCPGMSDGSASVNIINGTPPYTYYWSTGDTTESISGLSPGEYDVTIIDGNFCLANMAFTIVNPDSLHLHAEITGVACDGSSLGEVVLSAFGGTAPYTYEWSDGYSGSIVTGLASGNYDVKVTDSRDCELDTSIYVGLGEGCLDIASVMTPNGDGKNDTWVIMATENYPGLKVMVFDRTGTLVFESEGYTEAWDGRYNGNMLPVGSYFYTIDLGDGSSTISGTLDIVY